MPQRPMQMHTQRQAWEGHSATHPTALIAGLPPGRQPLAGPVPTPRPYGQTGLESELVCLGCLLTLAWQGGVSQALLIQGCGELERQELGSSGAQELGARGAVLLRNATGLAMV